MKWAGKEETQTGWEWPQGAGTSLGRPSSEPRLGEVTSWNLLQSRWPLPSPRGAGGRPEADAVQSREGAAQGTALGARLANGRVGGGPRTARLLHAFPAPPAPLRVPRPPADHQGRCLPVFSQTSWYGPLPRAQHLRAMGWGGAVRKKQSPPFESSALPAVLGPGVSAGKRPPRCLHHTQAALSSGAEGLDCLPDWLCDFGKTIIPLWAPISPFVS